MATLPPKLSGASCESTHGSSAQLCCTMVAFLRTGVEEFLHRTELGEPPPTEWGLRLYLEWFGQNGRIVVELGGPVVEECIRTPREGHEDDEGGWSPVPNLAIPPDLQEPQATAGPEITIIQADGEELEPEDLASDEGVYEEDREMMECELIDYYYDNCEQKPLDILLGDISKLPRPGDLDDIAIEAELKSLLRQLALFGVALDVCEHYSPRDSYKLLLDKILPDSGIYEELVGTGWVQHCCTYQYCSACEAEMEKEFEELDKRMERENN